MSLLIHSGQIIVVTGASKGIGAEIASTLGKLGARVVMLARDIDALNYLAEEIRQSNSGGEGLPFKVDLTNIEEIKVTVERIFQEIGVPDVLINNAGAGKWATIREKSVEDIIKDIAVPGISTMTVTKCFLERMIKKGTAKSPVHIINLTSPAGLGMYVPGTSSYSVARYMVTNFTELLRTDLRHHKDSVKISLVVPGKVSTNYFKSKEEESRVPMQRWIRELSPMEVATKISLIIKNRDGVDLVFPFTMKALVVAFKISPTIMQLFLTHVFGWQPPKPDINKDPKQTFNKSFTNNIPTIASLSLIALLCLLFHKNISCRPK